MGVRRLGRIGVLMGGPSTERKISLKSGEAVFNTLIQASLDAVTIDITTSAVTQNKRLIESYKIDCAFLALHGRFGEDGQMQEILDNLNIPYTGSGAQASRLAMDKIISREVFEANGLDVPRYEVRERPLGGSAGGGPALLELKFPLVVKPATHGSSIGLSLVTRKEDLDKAVGLAFGFDERILVEEYIKGREFTVGILDEKALPVVEIIPKKRLFDYEAKYEAGLTDYIVPARLEEEVSSNLKTKALAAHKVLGCLGCSRVDIILRHDSTPFILEINTIPGFTQTSLLPKAAKAAGINFLQLCVKLLNLAYEKTEAKRIL